MKSRFVFVITTGECVRARAFGALCGGHRDRLCSAATEGKENISHGKCRSEVGWWGRVGSQLVFGVLTSS